MKKGISIIFPILFTISIFVISVNSELPQVDITNSSSSSSANGIPQVNIIPPTPPLNYSIIIQNLTTNNSLNSNNSQYLQGLTPQQVANLYNETDWITNQTGHILYPYDSLDKVCIGSQAQCTNPSHKLLVIGGVNITGDVYLDNVAYFNSLLKEAIFNNNITINQTSPTNALRINAFNSSNFFKIYSAANTRPTFNGQGSAVDMDFLSGFGFNFMLATTTVSRAFNIFSSANTNLFSVRGDGSVVIGNGSLNMTNKNITNINFLCNNTGSCFPLSVLNITSVQYWKSLSDSGGNNRLSPLSPTDTRLTIGSQDFSSDATKYGITLEDDTGNGIMNRIDNNNYFGATYWFGGKDDSFRVNPYAMKLYQRSYQEMTAAYQGDVGNTLLFSARNKDDTLAQGRFGSLSINKDANAIATADVEGTGRVSQNLEVGNTDYSFPSIFWVKSPDRLDFCGGTLSACSSLTADPPCSNISGCEWGNCDGTLDCSIYDEATCLTKPLICSTIYASGCSDFPGLDCSMMDEATCLASSAGCTTNYNFMSCNDNPSLNCNAWDGDQTTCDYYTSTYGVCSWNAGSSTCDNSGSCSSITSTGDCNGASGCLASVVFNGCSTSGTCSLFDNVTCPTSYGCQIDNAFASCDNNGVCSDLTTYGSTTCNSYNGCSFGTGSPQCVGSILNTNCNQISYADCSPATTTSECNQATVNDTTTHIDQAGVGQTEDVYQCRDSSGNNQTYLDNNCNLISVLNITTQDTLISNTLYSNSGIIRLMGHQFSWYNPYNLFWFPENVWFSKYVAGGLIPVYPPLVAPNDLMVGNSSNRWLWGYFVNMNINTSLNVTSNTTLNNLNVTGNTTLKNLTVTNGTILSPDISNNVSALRLRRGLVSSSAVTNGLNNGSIEYENNSFYATNLVVRRTLVQAQEVITANITASNTASEITLLNIPHGAGYLRTGKMEEIELQGIVSSILGIGNNNLLLRVKYAGVTIGTFNMTEANRNNLNVDIHVLTTVRSSGSNGTLQTHSNMDIEGTLSDPISNTLVNIDTTTQQNLTVTAQWTDASTSNSLVILQGKEMSIDGNN